MFLLQPYATASWTLTVFCCVSTIKLIFFAPQLLDLTVYRNSKKHGTNFFRYVNASVISIILIPSSYTLLLYCFTYQVCVFLLLIQFFFLYKFSFFLYIYILFFIVKRICFLSIKKYQKKKRKKKKEKNVQLKMDCNQFRVLNNLAWLGLAFLRLLFSENKATKTKDHKMLHAKPFAELKHVNANSV